MHLRSVLLICVDKNTEGSGEWQHILTIKKIMAYGHIKVTI